MGYSQRNPKRISNESEFESRAGKKIKKTLCSQLTNSWSAMHRHLFDYEFNGGGCVSAARFRKMQYIYVLAPSYGDLYVPALILCHYCLNISLPHRMVHSLPPSEWELFCSFYIMSRRALHL
ncbi:hypothetical protein MKW98_019167, partial [Papaver atlanticum]